MIGLKKCRRNDLFVQKSVLHGTLFAGKSVALLWKGYDYAMLKRKIGRVS